MVYDSDNREAAAAQQRKSDAYFGGVCGVRTHTLENESDYQYGRMMVIANGGIDPEDKTWMFRSNDKRDSSEGDGALGLLALGGLWLAYETITNIWNYFINKVNEFWEWFYYGVSNANDYLAILYVLLFVCGLVGGWLLVRYMVRQAFRGLRYLAGLLVKALFGGKLSKVAAPIAAPAAPTAGPMAAGPMAAEEARQLIREDARRIRLAQRRK